MPTPIIFKPRIDNYDMRAEFYDYNYTLQYPTHGPEKRNPYNIQSSSALIRESAYLWGRWWETLEYPPTNRVWAVGDEFLTAEYINGNFNNDSYEDYTYWVDPSIYDHGQYTYQIVDNNGRYLYPYGAQEVGDLVTFIDTSLGVYFGGVVEYFRDATDYDISYLDTSQHIYPNPEPVKIMNITMNSYQGVLGQAIYAYHRQFNPAQNPLIIGKPIGAGKFTILYNKRYQDKRKGLTI